MPVETIQQFLVVFDQPSGQLIELIEFGTDMDAALAAYAGKEREHLGNRSIEVVLLGADSLETVKITHRHYFDRSVSSSKFLAGI